MEKQDSIVLTDEYGNQKEGFILAQITHNNNKYIVYSDSKNPNLNEKLLASRIDEFNDELILYPIETNEEWEFIENEFKKITSLKN